MLRYDEKIADEFQKKFQDFLFVEAKHLSQIEIIKCLSYAIGTHCLGAMSDKFTEEALLKINLQILQSRDEAKKIVGAGGGEVIVTKLPKKTTKRKK